MRQILANRRTRNARQVKAKNDGSTIGSTCAAGQAVKSMTIEFGIVTTVACGAI
jgi:hypothetical protein